MQADNAPGAADTLGQMSDIKEKLKGLLATKGVMTGAEWRRKLEDVEQRRKAGEFEIDKIVPGKVVEEETGGFYLVTQELPLDSRQGRVELGAVLDVIPEHIALSACDAELEEFEPATSLFMDIETIGLAGGTGTVAFLVGVGYFTEGIFRVEQCFMRDYDDEEAMLNYLDRLSARCQTVVSYNGKTFDLPLLRTRFIANRMPFRLDRALHFDLLHAARRFWKARLEDCTLSTIEQEILGVRRHGDVPSSQIPQIWFDYLDTRDARPLEKVFYHHKMDILSLVALTAWLSQCLSAPEGRGFEHSQDRLSLVRLHYRQKRYEEVVQHGLQFLETDADSPLRRECLELVAFAFKRRQDWPRMKDMWERLRDEDPKNLLARLELAKYYEHRARNLPAAEHECEAAVQFLETRIALNQHSDLDTWHLESFHHRLGRIRRKLVKGGFRE